MWRGCFPRVTAFGLHRRLLVFNPCRGFVEVCCFNQRGHGPPYCGTVNRVCKTYRTHRTDGTYRADERTISVVSGQLRRCPLRKFQVSIFKCRKRLHGRIRTGTDRDQFFRPFGALGYGGNRFRRLAPTANNLSSRWDSFMPPAARAGGEKEREARRLWSTASRPGLQYGTCCAGSLQFGVRSQTLSVVGKRYISDCRFEISERPGYARTDTDTYRQARRFKTVLRAVLHCRKLCC